MYKGWERKGIKQLLLNPLGQYSSRMFLCVLETVTPSGAVELGAAEVNRWLQKQGFTAIASQNQHRARRELERLGFIMQSKRRPQLYFLNPHLFPCQREDSTRHHKACEEWDRASRGEPEAMIDFGDVEGL